MSRTHKKHLSRARREALRLKAEAEKRGEIRGHVRPTPGLRRPRPKPKPAPQEHGPIHSRSIDLDRLVGNALRHDSKELSDRHRKLCAAALAQRPGLVDKPYRRGLLTMAWVPWIDDPGTWRPDGKGLTTAYRSLLAHVLGRCRISQHLWDMTLVYDGLGAKSAKRTMRFVAHLARGCSPRGLVGGELVPPPLSRRMLHLLVNPPRPMPLVAVARRAQVLGYGGTEALARCLKGTHLAEFRCHEEHWATVIHWLCRQSDLHLRDVGPFIDLFAARLAAGAPVSIKGRTVTSMRRLVREWHCELAQIREFEHMDFRPAGLTGGAWTVKRQVNGAIVPFERWSMQEILTARDLVVEGRAMRHCVASYRDLVISGRASIWSLTCNDQRRLTLEVDNRRQAIVQVRGRANRMPRGGEGKFIRAWARRNRLELKAWELRQLGGEG